MSDMPTVAIIKQALGISPMDLEPYYIQWVSCMTSEDLHSKSDIARVFAYQSKQNEELREMVKELGNELKRFGTVYKIMGDNEEGDRILTFCQRAEELIKEVKG